jgi:protein-disulfide isomerase
LAGAPVTLIEYGDFECPHCRTAYPIIDSVPRPELAGSQGRFWEMHDLLFQNQDELEDGDLIDYAMELGIDRELAQAALRSNQYAERVRQSQPPLGANP